MVAPSAKASCWDGSAANGKPRVRHSSVWRSIASGSLALITTRSRPPPGGQRGQLDPRASLIAPE